MICVGIDPGGDGALYAVKTDGVKIEAGSYLLMPMMDVGKRIKEVDISAALVWLRLVGAEFVAVEDVGYMPSAGKGFGDSILTGRVREIVGMLKAVGLPYELVRPQTWQAALGIKIPKAAANKAAANKAADREKQKRADREDRKKKVKAAVRAFCNRRHPDQSLVPPNCRVPHDGLSDALAVAHWAAVTAAGRTLSAAPFVEEVKSAAG